jgi:uncharacterized damage-inducible protein DinB
MSQLSEHINRTVTGPMWHGPALDDLLSGVTATSASTRPIEGAHTIWELVLHIAAWAEIVRSRLSMERTPEPTEIENFPPVPSPAVDNWHRDVERLKRAYADLARATSNVDDAMLEREVPGRGYSVREMLHGAIEHGTYHGGQIAVLKRALQLPMS